MELRKADISDAERIFEAWGRYPENFQRLTARPFRSTRDAHTYLRRLLASQDNLGFHILVEGTLVGLVKAVVEGHRAQVGYVVHKPYWGRGLATTAVQELVSTLSGMPSIQRVWATCALDNPGSIRVLEKCGFEKRLASSRRSRILSACVAKPHTTIIELPSGFPRRLLVRRGASVVASQSSQACPWRTS